MTPASLQSLKTLLEHAEGERDAAQAALREAEALARRHADQASELQSYRAQFQARWTAQFRQPTVPALLQCHHGFSQRLDQAIAQQDAQCRQQGQRVARAHEQLRRCEQRVAAVRDGGDTTFFCSNHVWLPLAQPEVKALPSDYLADTGEHAA